MDRRFDELSEAEARRSAAGAENRRRRRQRKRNGEKLLPGLAREANRGRGCANGGQTLPAAMRDGSLFPGCLADAAFAGRGFFHLGAHGVQIVGGRDHRKQQNNYTSEDAKEDERMRRRLFCSTTRAVRAKPLPPQQIGRQQQRKPAEIEKKFHAKCAILAQGNTGKTNTVASLNIIKIAHRRQVTCVPWSTKIAMESAQSAKG
jgi:hypothetical protein